MDETRTALSVVAEAAQFLSATSLGLFAGGMLTEGCVLVPYWRSLAPRDFLAWYAANGQRLQGFFGPLTSMTAVLSLAAAVLSMWEKHPGRWLASLAAAISVVVVSTFFLYFKKANTSFATASVGVEGVEAELARWARWHWFRTALSLAALAASAVSLWWLR